MVTFGGKVSHRYPLLPVTHATSGLHLKEQLELLLLHDQLILNLALKFCEAII